MFGTYLLFKRALPRYAVLAVLVVGVTITIASGELRSDALVIGLATPVWIAPEFSWQVILNIAFPLVMVALTDSSCLAWRCCATTATRRRPAR